MRFLQGDSSVLDELFKNIKTLYRMACKFGKLNGQESEENFEMGYAKIKEVFEYAFGIGEKRWHKGAIEISDNFKEICLKICSGLRISKNSV